MAYSMKNLQNLIPKINDKTNSSSCILFVTLFASLRVSSYCDWPSAIQSNVSNILSKDFKIAAVTTS